MTVFYQYELQTRRAAESVVQSVELRGELHEVLILMVNAETGTRGYGRGRLRPHSDDR